jgi:HEAT repeat protein
MRDMASSDRETQISAVRLAEYSRNPEIPRLLLEFLGKGGFKGLDFELKSTVIHVLGIIGNPTSLPGLEKFMSSQSMFRARPLNRLKVEVVQSLKNYPRKEVVDFLKKIADTRNNEIRLAAEEVYRTLQGGERAH